MKNKEVYVLLHYSIGYPGVEVYESLEAARDKVESLWKSFELYEKHTERKVPDEYGNYEKVEPEIRRSDSYFDGKKDGNEKWVFHFHSTDNYTRFANTFSSDWYIIYRKTIKCKDGED